MPAVTTTPAFAASATRPLGIGVLGCSDIALRRFMPAVAQCGRVRLIAIASRDMDKAAAVARQYACAALQFDELLNSEQIDLVYIPLPNHLHEEWVIKVLNHGKHVLCEKPLGLSPASVSRMLEAANRNGVLLYENIMYLQHPQHATVREMMAAGRIGSLSTLNCVFTIPGPAPDNFRLDPQQGGGAFHDMNRYPLSAARYFLRGAISEIIRCNVAWQNGMIISMEAEAHTTADEHFTFTIAFGQPYRCFYELGGSNGTLRLERGFTAPADYQCRLEINCSSKHETILMPSRDHFLLTIDHVAKLITDKGDFPAEHHQCLQLAQAADRFFRHAKTHGGAV